MQKVRYLLDETESLDRNMTLPISDLSRLSLVNLVWHKQEETMQMRLTLETEKQNPILSPTKISNGCHEREDSKAERST